MTRSIPSFFVTLALGLTVIASPQLALATLGEPASSVAADRRALGAAHRATMTRGSYTVQEEVSGANTVREYVNASGIVFAVAWQGLRHPDLNQLLGKYFPDFNEAKQRVPRTPGRRQMQVEGNKVVVQTWGHMRDLHGRAFLPALLPSGVTIDEIK